MALTNKALTTVANVQGVIGSSLATARIERAIEAVSERIAAYLGITVEYSASAVDWLRGEGQQLLRLKRRNIDSITSVYVSGTLQTVAQINSLTSPSDIVSLTVYRSAEWDEDGSLYRQAGWPIYGQRWKDLTHQRNISPNLRGVNIKVSYAGGYVTPAQEDNGGGTRDLPFDIEEAAIREVSYRVARPVGRLVSERTPGGWTQTWGGPAGGTTDRLLPETEAALLHYVRSHF